MTPKQKKRAWSKLRRTRKDVEVIMRHQVHGFVAKLHLKCFLAVAWLSVEFQLTFQRMLREAKNRKNIRQAYRYAIAAGIYKEGPGQYHMNWRAMMTGYNRLRRIYHDERTN